MCHQDKEEITENTAGHQSQQIKIAAAGAIVGTNHPTPPKLLSETTKYSTEKQRE